MHHPFEDDLNLMLDEAVARLKEADRVVAFTGAGVSAESGVPTFRGTDGLWEGHKLEEVATPMAFDHDPALVWRFYNARRANLRDIAPNPGHHALVELETQLFPSGKFTVITQNVDSLHRLAGSQNIVELHGNLKRTRCTQCGVVEDRGLEPLDELPRCPRCTGLLRPDIVWFYEQLSVSDWERAARATALCDLFLVMGTSAVVYPAAGLVSAARRAGAFIIEINLTHTEASDSVDLGLYGPFGVLLPQLVQRLKERP